MIILDFELRGVCRDPKRRPSIASVARHPCWWLQATKLQFLIDTSDAYELSDRAADSSSLRALEATAPSAFPPGTNWATSLEKELIANLYQYRSYKYSSVRDLLRVIRNKCNHFREMPEELQALIGEPPDAYYAYFGRRFPRLFLTMFFFVLSVDSRSEALFRKYDLEGADFSGCAAVHFRAVSAQRGPLVRLGFGAKSEGTDNERSTADNTSAAKAAHSPPRIGQIRSQRDHMHAASVSTSATSSSAATVSTAPLLTTSPENLATGLGRSTGSDPEAHSAEGRSLSECSATARVGGLVTVTPRKSLKEKKRRHRLNARAVAEPPLAGHASPPSVSFVPAMHAVMHPPHPPPPVSRPLPPPPMPRPPVAPADMSRTPVGLHDPPGLAAPLQVGWQKTGSPEHTIRSFPQNPGNEPCQFFVQTGTCRFGENCFKHHPEEYSVPLNQRGFPMREGKLECPFYMQTGSCKFGEACKYHHPNLAPVFAGSDL